MKEEFYIHQKEIKRIRNLIEDPILSTQVLSDILRINTLYMIDKAGSGHIGSSFSSMEIITWLWTQQMRNPNQSEITPSDTYYSSKGHDIPALYSLLIGLEKIENRYIHQLRRLNGLPGHPDIHTPYIVTNTGALGMGISKARGMALANRLDKKTGQFYILTGDGELQEGQFWESLQPTSNKKLSEITVIIDHNKLQSDTLVSEVSNLGNLEKKLETFGWEVFRCDGHNIKKLQDTLTQANQIKDKPQIIIADTIKGKGVPFLESSKYKVEDRLYKYHSGALSHKEHHQAVDYLLKKVNTQLELLNISPLELTPESISKKISFKKPEKLITAYEEELVRLGHINKDIVVLDADLAKDCGLLSFEKNFPERFIESGIAEQDMVSMAGGLALKGKLPIVHSFGCFLTTRANEQIYNNSTEETKIIYVGSLTGLLPAGPGHSHQSVRDISLVGSIPNITIVQPSNEQETKMALNWAVHENSQSTYIRLVSIPYDLPYTLPEDYRLEVGKGVTIKEGTDSAIISYGPVMLSQGYEASKILEENDRSIALINFPWLNRINKEWLINITEKYPIIFTLEDHYSQLGLSATLSQAILSLSNSNRSKIITLGLEEIPICGQNDEALRYHKLDSQSIKDKVSATLQ